MGRRFDHRYSVYDRKTEMPVMIYATSKECAEAMGVTLHTFYRYIHWERTGKGHQGKWAVFEDEVDDE